MKGWPEGGREEDRARSRRIETEKEKRKVPRMSARRKRRRGARSEGGRSGSPALLALRWLKAKESARPRTRPGRDLLPSSFLHPALSPRRAAALLHRARRAYFAETSLLFSLLRSFPSRCTPLYANNCIMDALLLSKVYYAHVGDFVPRHEIQQV